MGAGATIACPAMLDERDEPFGEAKAGANHCVPKSPLAR